jgi:hypothetical protein
MQDELPLVDGATQLMDTLITLSVIQQGIDFPAAQRGRPPRPSTRHGASFLSRPSGTIGPGRDNCDLQCAIWEAAHIPSLT